MNPDIQSGQQDRARQFWLVSSVLVLLIFFIIFILYGALHHSASFPKADQQLKATTYEGMSSFIDKGLSTDQVNDIAKAFAKFSPSAQTVSVDTESLVLSPSPKHNGTFFVKFDVSVDSKGYRGTVSFSDIESIRMVLYNQSDKNIFDSGVIKPTQP